MVVGSNPTPSINPNNYNMNYDTTRLLLKKLGTINLDPFITLAEYDLVFNVDEQKGDWFYHVLDHHWTHITEDVKHPDNLCIVLRPTNPPIPDLPVHEGYEVTLTTYEYIDAQNTQGNNVMWVGLCGHSNTWGIKFNGLCNGIHKAFALLTPIDASTTVEDLLGDEYDRPLFLHFKNVEGEEKWDRVNTIGETVHNNFMIHGQGINNLKKQGYRWSHSPRTKFNDATEFVV